MRTETQADETNNCSGRRARISTVAAVAFFALIAFPGISRAADLSFSPASATHSVGDSFSVKVLVEPNGDSVNAADGTISFDKSLLSMQSVSKDSSVFSLWTSDPTFSNANGTVTFSGGTPSAFSKQGTIVTLKMKALKAGSAKLSYAKGSILAADGKGTDVYANGIEATIIIKEATETKVPAPADISEDVPDVSNSSVDTGPPPPAPVVDSPSFPKEDAWYATSTGLFAWKLLPDVIGVRTGFSDSASTSPKQAQESTATSTVVSGIKDGVSYFAVQFKNMSGWGDVTHRKVKIDTVPPDDFDVTITNATGAGDTPKFTFKTQDSLSGVDHYKLLIGDATIATITDKDFVNGGYPIPPQDGGEQKVTVRAYDAAGNMREVVRTLTLPKVAKPNATDATPDTSSNSGWTIDRILLILFAIGIGSLATWTQYFRKKVAQDRAALLRQIAEVADKNDKVFSAMREEFEQMINDFDKRPQLTPEERALLEDVKEVLDISEELIDSGVDDLKKLVRGNGS